MIDIDNNERSSILGLKFIDLFAGIGGFRYALESFGGECVFTSEWDKSCQENYLENFGDKPNGDITKIDEKDILPHNIIAGGFPCQAFSISGRQKGFEEARGTLFFDIVRIADYHKPEILLLENVRHFERHDQGRTLKVVIQTLNEIGYTVFYKVLVANNYGLPQNRQRIYFVAFKNELSIIDFKFPAKQDSILSLEDILEPEEQVPEHCYINRSDVTFNKAKMDQYKLFDFLPNRTVQIGTINKGGQGERIYSPRGHSVTLSATTGGPGGSTGVYLINDKLRRLTPRECARLQGFPEHYKIHPTKSRAYFHFGNSVPINVLQYLIIQINQSLVSRDILIHPK